MAKLPYRTSKDHKSHALRIRTYARNLPVKALNIKENTFRAEQNRERGFTGKEFDNAMRKAFGPKYRTVKRMIQDGRLDLADMHDDLMRS